MVKAENAAEREGIVKVGFKGLGFKESKLGFLRWWSLIKEWSFSATWDSRGERLEVVEGTIEWSSSSSSW